MSDLKNIQEGYGIADFFFGMGERKRLAQAQADAVNAKNNLADEKTRSEIRKNNSAVFKNSNDARIASQKNTVDLYNKGFIQGDNGNFTPTDLKLAEQQQQLAELEFKVASQNELSAITKQQNNKRVVGGILKRARSNPSVASTLLNELMYKEPAVQRAMGNLGITAFNIGDNGKLMAVKEGKNVDVTTIDLLNTLTTDLNMRINDFIQREQMVEGESFIEEKALNQSKMNVDDSIVEKNNRVPTTDAVGGKTMTPQAYALLNLKETESLQDFASLEPAVQQVVLNEAYNFLGEDYEVQMKKNKAFTMVASHLNNLDIKDDNGNIEFPTSFTDSVAGFLKRYLDIDTVSGSKNLKYKTLMDDLAGIIAFQAGGKALTKTELVYTAGALLSTFQADTEVRTKYQTKLLDSLSWQEMELSRRRLNKGITDAILSESVRGTYLVLNMLNHGEDDGLENQRKQAIQYLKDTYPDVLNIIDGKMGRSLLDTKADTLSSNETQKKKADEGLDRYTR